MSKPVLGLVVGGLLGLVDGLSAWFSPEARPMLSMIVVGSTLKGIVTGVCAGLLARWRQSMSLGVVGGVVIGFAFSSLAAIGQGEHYLEIVLPGMLVGALVGFVTQRYPAVASRTLASVAIAVMPLIGTGLLAANQAPSSAEPLAPLTALLGRWAGTTDGQPGKGTVEREYERVLGRFVQVRNKSTYPPQDKNPKGEVHEDLGLFSFDRARKQIIFRQFHSEGFVNEYALDASSTPTRLVFTTETIENIPKGWRARETYVLTGTDQLEEIFELAEPGKEFELYSRNRLTRVR